MGIVMGIASHNIDFKGNMWRNPSLGLPTKARACKGAG
jgi:hypothetical protein